MRDVELLRKKYGWVYGSQKYYSLKNNIPINLKCNLSSMEGYTNEFTGIV